MTDLNPFFASLTHAEFFTAKGFVRHTVKGSHVWDGGIHRSDIPLLDKLAAQSILHVRVLGDGSVMTEASDRTKSAFEAMDAFNHEREAKKHRYKAQF